METDLFEHWVAQWRFHILWPGCSRAVAEKCWLAKSWPVAPEFSRQPLPSNLSSPHNNPEKLFWNPALEEKPGRDSARRPLVALPEIWGCCPGLQLALEQVGFFPEPDERRLPSDSALQGCGSEEETLNPLDQSVFSLYHLR